MFQRILFAVLLVAVPAPAFAAEPADPSAQVAPAVTPGEAPRSVARRAKPATSAERERYAAREAASPGAKRYRGGDDVVVVGASTLTVVLAVVLLVVLL